MSNKNKPEENIDMDRYFNDPEYRRKILAERNAKELKSATEKKDSESTFNLKKTSDKPKSSFNLSDKKKSPTSQKPDTYESLADEERQATPPTTAADSGNTTPPEPPKNDDGGKPPSNFGDHSNRISWSRIFAWLGVFVLISLAGAIAFINYLMIGLPSIEELENPQTDVASFVMSRDGEILDRYFTENRTYIRYEDMSSHIIDALVAVEDHRYYDHWGIDIFRTLAIPYHLIRGNPQGGSTISQQLARNLYRSIGREVTATRKFREIITAIQIEQNYTKREIIEMYLNTVEFSNSAFGIESASRVHYSKPASDLNIIEAATMIGTLRAVYAFNPRIRHDASLRRRNVVLAQMMRHGFIDRQEFEVLREEPIVLDYNPPSRTSRQNRYFGEYVRQQVQEWTRENGYDLYRDGLVIYTTIDSRYQHYAHQSVENHLANLQVTYENAWTTQSDSLGFMDKMWEEHPRYLEEYIMETDEYKNGFFGYKTHREVVDSLKQDTTFIENVKRNRQRLEASFVAIDPSNGNVMAWIGGSDYSRIQRDNVNQSRRQTGSTFKPFVYALAIDNGYKPYHRFSKYPVSFIDRTGSPWEPRDPTVPAGPEMIDLRQAIARSLNNVTVRLLPELAGAPGTNRLEDLFPAGERIVEFAQSMGINKSPMQPYPSIALGTAQASLLEVVSAYTTFANKGVHIEPMAIARIEDKDGNVLQEYFPEYSGEVMSPETAYIMIDMMRGVIRGGTDLNGNRYHGTGTRMGWQFGVRQDVAGKTGTTQNSADGWFMAMMPHLVMGAWVGGEDRRVRWPRGSADGQGARTALPIVGGFIQAASNDPNAPWARDTFEPPHGFVMEMPEDEPVEEPTRQGRISW